MRTSKLLCALMVSSAIVLSATAASAIPVSITLPAPVEGVNSLTYGTNGTGTTYDDWHVFSLPYSYFLETGIATGNPTGNWGIDSSPGLIKDYVVILSSPASARDNSDTLGGSGDDAFDAVNAQTGVDREVFTATGAVSNNANLPEPGGSGQFTGDQDGMWDVRLSALRNYLTTGTGSHLNPVFFYNMNEQGQGLDQDELVWGKLVFTDDAGILPDLTFIFDGTTILPVFEPQINGGAYDFDDLTGFGDTNGPSASVTPAGWVHGVICVGHDAGNTPASRYLVALGKCSDAPPAPPGITYEEIDQNLGANIAAFAVINDAVGDAVWNMGYDAMHADFRNGRIDNGYEQLFIGGVLRQEVPEPGALFLLGSGLLGLGLARRRAARK